MILKLWIDQEVKAVTRTIEVSGGGVRIVDPGIHLSKNMIVDIEFPKGSLPIRDNNIVTCMVVHTTDRSTGLMFGNELSIAKLLALYGNKRVRDEEFIFNRRRDESKRKTLSVRQKSADELESVVIQWDA